MLSPVEEYLLVQANELVESGNFYTRTFALSMLGLSYKERGADYLSKVAFELSQKEMRGEVEALRSELDGFVIQQPTRRQPRLRLQVEVSDEIEEAKDILRKEIEKLGSEAVQ